MTIYHICKPCGKNRCFCFEPNACAGCDQCNEALSKEWEKEMPRLMRELQALGLQPTTANNIAEAVTGIGTQYALHQFIGYGHAKKGYGVKDLAEAMGLTAAEWPQIKDEVTAWLSESDIDEITKYLEGQQE